MRIPRRSLECLEALLAHENTNCFHSLAIPCLRIVSDVADEYGTASLTSCRALYIIYTHYLSSRPKQDSARGYLGGKGLDREGVQGFANASPISWPPFHARIHHALFNSSNRR